MKELKSEIKSGNLKQFYLFYGEEDYLIKLYEKQMCEKLIPNGAEMMNLDVFSGKDIKVEHMIDAADTLPFMNECRLIICKGTGLFASGKKDESEMMWKFLKDVPETTTILFVDKDVDKRGKLFKRVNEQGRAVEFKLPTEKELVDWVVRTCKKLGKVISTQTAQYLLRTVDGDMESVILEMDKLILFSDQKQEITTHDIDSVCTFSLETKIFNLVDAVGNREPEKALDIFSNLVLMKESPIMVISMIARQFRLILQCKHLQEKGMGASEIAEAIGQRSFIVNSCLRQSRNFELSTVKNALNDCLESDVAIKSGKISDRLAVEILIMKYSN